MAENLVITETAVGPAEGDAARQTRREIVRRVEPHMLHHVAARAEDLRGKLLSRASGLSPRVMQYDLPFWYAEDVGALLALANDAVAALHSGGAEALKKSVARMARALEAPPAPEPARPNPEAVAGAQEREARGAMARQLAAMPADKLAALQGQMTALALEKAPERKEPAAAGRK